MSNFIVVPEEFVTKDSGRSKKEIYVKATGYNVSQKLPEVMLPLEEFERMNWPSCEWGFSAITEGTV